MVKPKIINFGDTAIRMDLVEAIIKNNKIGTETFIFLQQNKDANHYYIVQQDFETVLMKWHASLSPENKETK